MRGEGGLLGRIGAWLKPGRHDPGLLEAVERAVARVEPKLRHGAGYPGRYLEPMAHALEHARRLARAVPGPVPLDRRSFASDPLVHALFATPDDIGAHLCQSQSLRDWLRGRDRPGRFFGLLGLRRREKRLLGLEARGEQVVRDVAQTAVYFADATLTGLAASEADARRLMEAHFLDSLLIQVGERHRQAREERRRLERLRDEARADLRAGRGDAAALEAALSGLRALAPEQALERLGADLARTLACPDECLRLEPVSLRLDPMGLVRPPAAGGEARNLDFMELHGRDRRIWTVLLVACGTAELAPYAERLEQARRWMAI